MDVAEKKFCEYYKPIYRERVIRYEDKYGNPYEYREDFLFAEFCIAKEDFILSELNCSCCQARNKSKGEAAHPFPLAG